MATRDAERQLPTFDQILGHALAAVDEAYRLLGDAQDWLRSDWSPAGSALTDGQAAARRDLQAGLAGVKRALNQAKSRLALNQARSRLASRPETED